MKEDAQIISTNIEVQEGIAIETIGRAFDVLKPKQAFFIRGTEAHSGPSAQSDERVAEALLGTPADELGTRYAKIDLEIDIEGVITHIAHHVPTSRRGWTRGGNIIREVQDVLIAWAEAGKSLPNLIVRGHAHRAADTGQLWERTLGIIAPCWKLADIYGRRVSRVPPHIGGILVAIRKGEIVEYKIAKFRMPHRRPVKV